MLQSYLGNIQIVMVNTTLPANIGSAARAMHTMGLQHLTLVEPKHPINADSEAHAAGGVDILKQAKTVQTLSDALADCRLVFAASSRNRHIPRPVIKPTQAAEQIFNFINNQPNKTATQPKIAIIFGREDRGLTNEELAYADYHIQINANPNYPVLNVASAIQVISSFIYDFLCQQTLYQKETNKSSLAHTDTTSKSINIHFRQDWDEPAISQQQQQQLTDKMIQLMCQLELADKNDLKSLPSRLARLNSRLQLDQKEFQLINAVFGKMMKKVTPKV